MITSEQIQIVFANKERVVKFYDPLSFAMTEFEINTPLRQAAFLGQLAVESGQFLYVREIASGAAYEGRKDLGNVSAGDGVKYKGRGLIQITGKANYIQVAKALNIDCVEHPEVLELPINACRSAAWFWKNRGLNELADAQNYTMITRKINGGLTAYNERLKFYNQFKKVLKCY